MPNRPPLQAVRLRRLAHRSGHHIVNCPLSTIHYETGFSFTEVLFAVMLLGIGFIMIAAVFPVAIQQNQATLQETTAQSVANDAINQLRNLTATTTGQIFQNTSGAYVGMNTPWWASQQNFGLNFIDSADPRFAWVGFYRRDNGDNSAKFIIVVLQNHNSTVPASSVNLAPSAFSQGDTYPFYPNGTLTAPYYIGPPIIPGSLVGDSLLNTGVTPSALPHSQVAAPILASVFYNADGTSSIAMSALDVTSTSAFPAYCDMPVTWAAPGAFVIVGVDLAGGTMSGRVFRLGQPLGPNEPNWQQQFNGPGTTSNPGAGITGFQLVPGFDLRQDQSEYRATINNNYNGALATGGLGVFVIGTPTNPGPPPGQTAFPIASGSSPNFYELTGCPSGVAQDVAVFYATIPCK